MKAILRKTLFFAALALVFTFAFSVKVNAKTQISQKKATVMVTKTVQLSVTGNTKPVKKWTSSNKKIATVSQTGLVTGKKAGTVKIKAKVGKKTYSCTVKVIKGLDYGDTDLEDLYVGETASVRLCGTKIKSVKTSNSNVIKADKNGNLNAVGVGDAMVTFTGKDKKKYRCSVSVKDFYTVTFEANGGTAVEPQVLKQNNRATKPNCTYAEHVLADWYSDKACTTPYDFSRIVTQNMTLYAAWRDAHHTVSFVNEGSRVDAQIVEDGLCAFQPEDPLKRGSVFTGIWYQDRAYRTAYDFTTPVYTDTTLYGTYDPLQLNLSFTEGNESTVNANASAHREIKGKVETNGIIDELTYEIDRPFNDEEGELAPDANGNFALSETMEDGPNTLTVRVKTLDGTEQTAQTIVNYDSGQVYSITSDSSIKVKPVSGAAITGASLGTAQTEDDTLGSAVYVSNVLNLYFQDGLSFEERKSFVETTLGAEVAGYLNGVSMMQAKFDASSDDKELPSLGSFEGNRVISTMTEEDLQKYAQALTEGYSNKLVAVDFDYAYQDTAAGEYDDYRTDDAYKGWFNSVNAAQAAAYDEYKAEGEEKALDFLSDITIGIVDAGFDSSHADLRNLTLLNNPSVDNHGTHVAGIIGATDNNEIGIAGVMHDNASILGYGAQNPGEYGMTDSSIEAGLVKTVEAGAKVVNFSLGASHACSGNHDVDKDLLDRRGANASRWIGRLLDRGYDFVVVQAAGNGNSSGVPTSYTNNGLFCSVNRENCYNSDRTDKEDILNRILIVSATNNDGKLTSFSNGPLGTDKVPAEEDTPSVVAAPGLGMLSTVIDGYAQMNGTSMATPVVTAVAGLAWSANPALKGDEVVSLVREGGKSSFVQPADDQSGRPVKYGTLSFADAAKTTRLAYESRVEYSGRVVESTSGNDGIAAVIELSEGGFANDAPVNPKFRTVNTDYSGNFTIGRLPRGTYTMKIIAEGKTPILRLITVNDTDTNGNLGDFPLSGSLGANAYRIVLTWGETPSDLDSHLVGIKSTDNSYFHVYYGNKEHGSGIANLDWDDTTSYGPETITVENFQSLQNIRYAVHDFSNMSESICNEMSLSGAKVEVYKGNAATPFRTFTVPRNMGGTEWQVFAFDARGNIIPINRMSYQSSERNVLREYYPGHESEDPWADSLMLGSGKKDSKK